MTTIKPDTFETLSKAFHCIDKNDIRPKLQHIEIAKIQVDMVDTIVVTSTNGHVAFKKEIKDEGLMQIINNTNVDKIYIHIDQWPALKLIAKSKYAVEVNLDNNKINTNFANVEIRTNIDYPNVGEAIKANTGDILGILTFNLKQLESLAKSMTRKSTKIQTITLTIPRNPMHAMIVTSTNELENGIIMPIIKPRGE